MTTRGSAGIRAAVMVAFALFASALPAGAQQVTLPSVTVGRASTVAPADALTYYQSQGLTSQVRASNPDAEITELARALKNDPDLIYDWVRNNAEIELTFGLSKGARGVAIDKSGTAADQAHLMVELLRASNITAKYVFGTITLTGQQFIDWTGIADAAAAAQILGNGGIPATISSSGATISSVTLMHVWVKATIGGTDYVFDPAYKPYTFKTGIDLGAAMGFNGSTFVSNALSGSASDTTLGFPRLRNLNEANVASGLTANAQALLTHLKTNMPNARMDDVIGGQDIVPYYGIPVRQTSLPYTSTTYATFDNDIPNSLRTTLRIRGGGTLDASYYADEIYGKMLTLERVVLQVALKLDGVTVATVASGTFFTETPAPKLTFDINHPYAASSGAYMDRQLIQTAFINNGPVVIFVGWGDVSPDLSARLAQRVGYGTVVTRATRKKCWYVMGEPECDAAVSQSVATHDATGIRAATGWLAQFSRMSKVYARMSGSVVQHHHTVGVVSALWTTYNNGDLIRTSLKMNLESGISLESKSNDAAKRQAAIAATVSAANTLEGSLVNQTTGGGSPVSVAAKLDWVNRETLATDTDWVYYADSSTWAAVKAQLLTDYKQQKIAADQAEAFINAGYNVVIPRSGDLGPGLQSVIVNMGPPVLTTPGPERGSALIAVKPDDSSLAYVVVRDSATEKGGGGSVELTPSRFYSSEENFLKDLQQTRSQDFVVDQQSGAFSYTAPPDLTVGNGGYPYSLSFQRAFSAGSGWVHNFASNVDNIGNGLLASGAISPREAAEMMVAFHAQLYLAPTSQSSGLDKLKRHVIAAVVDKWWADRLELNQLTFSVGFDGFAFTKLADGTWYPAQGDATQLTVQTPADPANGTCSATPTYILTLKDQSTVNFSVCASSTGAKATLLKSLAYPYGMTVTLTYGANLQLTEIENTLGRKIKVAVSANNTIVKDDSDTGNVRTVTLHNASFCPFMAPPCSTIFSGATNPMGHTTTYTYASVGPVAPQQHLAEVRLPSNPNKAFVSFAYDHLSRVKTATDIAGNVWNYLYANGRRGGVTDPLGSTAFTIYDGEGNVARTVDALGHSKAYEYDAHRRVTKVTAPEGNRTEYTYDAKHNVTVITELAKPGSALPARSWTATHHATFNTPVSVTDSLGRVTSLSYDATTGRVLTRTQPSVGGQAPVSVYTYNGRGQLLTQTDPTGLVTQFDYHSANGNMLSSIVDPGAGHVASTTLYSYDQTGNVASRTDPNGNVTSATYDKMRRITLLSLPLSAQVKQTFNLDGLLTKVEAATGDQQTPWAVETLTYDARHNLIASVDPDSRTTTFEYDAVGRRVLKTDAEYRRAVVVYDTAGRVIQKVEGENSALQQAYKEMTYSPNGEVVTERDAKNNVTTNTYDGFGRLSRKTFADSTYEEFSYDSNDNVLSVLTRGGQLITHTYDTLDRTATKIVPQPGGAPSIQTSYSYDLVGRLTQASDTAGHAIGYVFDSAKRVASVSQAGPGIPAARTVSYQHDPAGNRTRLTWPDGYYVQYSFDALHRLATVTENGTFVLSSYTYDPLSRRTGVANGNGTSASSSYTTASDLLSLVNNFVGSSVTLSHSFTHAHQLSSETVSNAAWQFAPATFETIAYATNNLNQYTQVTKGTNPTVALSYDAGGNLTSDGTWAFAFDAENKLVSATKAGTVATYAYDPLLRREGKTVNGTTTTFLLDGAEEIGDYDAAGVLLRRFVPSQTTDQPIAMVEGSGVGSTHQWFHRNRLGSTIAMSDGVGAVSEGPITYDPFGNSSSTGGVPFKYTGRRYDAETGLYYYRARYYSSGLKRFLQTDPIGSCDNMNLYTYVANDPLNGTDPSGLAVERVVVIGERQPARGSGALAGATFQLGSATGSGGADNPYGEPKEGECRPTPGAESCEKVTVTGQRQPRPPVTLADWQEVERFAQALERNLPRSMENSLRHCIGSCILAKRYGVAAARAVGYANEIYGFFRWDLMSIASGRGLWRKITGEAGWAFSQEDFAANEVGFDVAQSGKPCGSGCKEALKK